MAAVAADLTVMVFPEKPGRKYYNCNYCTQNPTPTTYNRMSVRRLFASQEVM
jgi:hypothetical protein